MSNNNSDHFLRELSADAPCGPNLEYDADFVALEQDVIGKPEVQYGDTITAAVAPEWKSIQRVAMQLLERSRDLRLVVFLLRANLHLLGVSGLKDSLHLIERLLEERWDSVHPMLDVDDDMDPTLRINSLEILADRATVLKELRDVTLIMLPGLGPLSLRLLDIASGELATPEGQEKISMESIERALCDVDADVLATVQEALACAYDSAVNIAAVLVQRVGHAHALNLDGLTRMLKLGRDVLVGQAKNHAADGGFVAASDAPAVVNIRRSDVANDDISSREDVVRMLNKLIAYYEQHEPSSPLPLLFLRARRLLPKNFLEILQDISPDGLQQALFLCGPEEES